MASHSNTRRSREHSQSQRRETSVSYYRRHHAANEGTSSPSLEDRVRRMEESQNKILQLLQEARQPEPQQREEHHPIQNQRHIRGVQPEEIHIIPPHPQEGVQQRDVELLDTASSAHPSRRVLPPCNPPMLVGNLPQVLPADIHHQAVRDELRRLMQEEFPLRNRDTHSSHHNFQESSPFVEATLQHPIPMGFKLPNIDSYEGATDPYEHVDHYRTIMHLQRATDAVLCRVFPATLKGQARTWFYSLPRGTIHTFEELAKLFVEQFIANRRIIKDSSHLSGIRQNEGESLKEYFQRFSNEARQVLGVDPELLRGILLGGLRPGPFYSSLMRDTVHSYTDLVHRIEAQISADEAINAHRKQFEQFMGKRKTPPESVNQQSQRGKHAQKGNNDFSPRSLQHQQDDSRPEKEYAPFNTSRTNV